EAKEKQIVRAHGVSCHSIEALHTASVSPWVEVDLARLNHRGAHMDASPAEVCSVLDRMHAAGKGIIGMKIFGQGDLSSDTDKEASLRFALSRNCLHAMVIGFERPEQIDDAIRRINAILASTATTAAA